jgi:hypothetical protein
MTIKTTELLKIKTTELLKLFTKANELGLRVEVREDNGGDYVVRIYEMFCQQDEFDETVVITQRGESDLYKGSYCYDVMVSVLDEMLEDKRKKEIKEQKRQELIARLTDEEKELLGVK